METNMNNRTLWTRALGVLLLMPALLMSLQAQASYADRKDVQAFIDEMVKEHGFDRDYLVKQFSKAKRLNHVLESIAKPAEKELTWKQYRPIFVTEKRARMGREFIKKNLATLQRAEAEFGVPKEIVAAIIGVETYYGRHTGKHIIFDSLTTLGFDYPPRAKFFRSELKQFLLLSKEEHIDIEDMTGSYAGAMGMPQFISSSYRAYAVDFDGDGKRDLWHSVPDVIGSVANYFKKHGWVKDGLIAYPVDVTDESIVPKSNKLKPYATVAQFKKQGVKIYQPVTDSEKATLIRLDGKKGIEYWLGFQNFYAISRYNHSELYSMAVFHLSQKLED